MDDTSEMVDWLSSNQRAQDPTRSFVKPTKIAAGTIGKEACSQRPNFARSESSSDEMMMETIELLLDNEDSEPVTMASEGDTEEDQDWDDYTLVEVALFLQPAW